jgi:hypothetical protein
MILTAREDSSPLVAKNTAVARPNTMLVTARPYRPGPSLEPAREPVMD